MSSREAIKQLERAGYVARTGKGDHVILRNRDRVIIVPGGKQQLSSGMTAKVRSHLQKLKQTIGVE